MSKVQLKHLAAATAEFYSMSLSDLLGKSRTRNCAHPRHVMSHVAVRNFGYSLTRVAQYLDCDHTSVLHGVKAVEKREVPEEHLSWIKQNAEHRDNYSRKLMRESVERMHYDGAA